MTLFDSRLQRDSLRHRIADEIRKAIFRGKLTPGQKVTESQLAEEMNVSRGPIREALQLLETEGLLTSTPYKETRVSQFSHDEVVQLLIPIRLSMEIFALKKTHGTLADTCGTQFDHIIQQMKKAYVFDDKYELLNLDMQFHETLIRSVERPHVVKLWDVISSRIHLYFVYNRTATENWDYFVADHEMLLAALLGSDLAGAIETLRKHIMVEYEYYMNGD